LVSEKIFSGSFIEAYFNNLASTVEIRDWQVMQPVKGVHAITSAGTAPAVAFTSCRLSVVATPQLLQPI
jgi:hypothetical protein